MTRRVRVSMPAPAGSVFHPEAADHWVGEVRALTLYGTVIGMSRITGVHCARDGSALLLDIDLDLGVEGTEL